MLSRIAKAVITRRSQSGARFYHPAEFKPPTYNELPVPQGSWQKKYESNQKKYNMHLVGGLAVFIISVVVIGANDLIFFNAFPPKSPKEMYEESQ